jgi:hypothetical protein
MASISLKALLWAVSLEASRLPMAGQSSSVGNSPQGDSYPHEHSAQARHALGFLGPLGMYHVLGAGRS